jgi:hypothetical protein
MILEEDVVENAKPVADSRSSASDSRLHSECARRSNAEPGSHSRNWGYGPSGGLGLIAVIILILVLMRLI